YDNISFWEGRIIVACVASNLQRVQQVIDAAYRANRKIVLTGQDFGRIIRTAMKLGKLELPDEDILITQKAMKKYKDNQLIILETGRMGEPIKALQKMASGSHHRLRIKEGDLVYITTTPTIAMETYVAKTKDMIYEAGGEGKNSTGNFSVYGQDDPNALPT